MENEYIEVITREGRTIRSGSLTVEECTAGIQVTHDALRLGVAGADRGTVHTERAEFRGPGGVLLLTDSNSVYSGLPGSVAISIGTPPAAHQASQGPMRKIGRNDPCYCGSGKKYKRCHGS